MKKILSAVTLGLLVIGLTGCHTFCCAKPAPKKLLVVTTTASFRHSSIPTAEKILAQLAQTSGEFTLDFVEQPPGHPATGFPPKLKADATPAEQKAFNDAEAAFNEKLKTALLKLAPDNLKNYDPAKVHDLLIMDKHPEHKEITGHFPVAWCKVYGKSRTAPGAHGAALLLQKNLGNPGGRVFYTSLGHREDVWDADPALKDRKNDPAISRAYQQHVLGGIEWALGLKNSAP